MCIPLTGFFVTICGGLSFGTVFLSMSWPAGRPPPPFNSTSPLSTIPFTQLGELFLLLLFYSVTERPSFTPRQRMFKNIGAPLLVSLSCATANATIYYTTDGSTPTPVATSSSTQTYTSPIAVSATTTMKAVGVCPGHLDSFVVEAQFCFAGKVICLCFFSLQT